MLNFIMTFCVVNLAPNCIGIQKPKTCSIIRLQIFPIATTIAAASFPNP